MPSAWPDEALKAQAVAAVLCARAPAQRQGVRPLRRRSQPGLPAGSRGASAHAAAVQATKGEVLLSGRASRSTRTLPLDVGRRDTRRGGGLRQACPVPRRGRGPAQRSRRHTAGGLWQYESTLRKGAEGLGVKSLQLAQARSGRVSSPGDDVGGDGEDHRRCCSGSGGLGWPWVTQLVPLSLTRPGGPVRYGKSVARSPAGRAASRARCSSSGWTGSGRRFPGRRLGRR